MDLTWAQWHALNPGIFGCVTRPRSNADALVQLALSPAVKSGRDAGVRLSYIGSLSRLDSPALRLKLHLSSLASALQGHVVRYTGLSTPCGSKPSSLHCPDWSEGAMYRPGGSGDGPQQCDPVNLATGEEEYAPAPDLVVYDSQGPTIAWGRVYNSLRGLDPPNTTYPTYNPADFGIGWSHTYNYRMMDLGIITGAVHAVNLYLPNGAVVPITGTPPVNAGNFNACTVPAGTPFHVDWVYNNSPAGLDLVVTMADRSRFMFTNTAGTPVYLLTQIMDNNGKSIILSYKNSLLTGIGNSANGTGIIIQRNSDNSISSVNSYNGTTVPNNQGFSNSGQIVFYHTAKFGSGNVPAQYPQYPELDNVSVVQSNAAGQTNPFTSAQPSTFMPGTSRWTYGYATVPSGHANEQFTALTGIMVASPASTGGTISPATSFINYNNSYVTSLVDANKNTTTFTSPTANTTTVAVTNSSGNAAYSYTVGFDMNMNMTSKTDGSGSTVTMAKTFNSTADPYRPDTVTNGNKNTWKFVWDQFGNLHQTTSPRGVVTNYTWAFSGTVPSVVNSVSQASAPILGELVSIQQGSKTSTKYTYYDTAYPGQGSPLSPDATNSGLTKTITTALPGTPGTANSTSYSFTYNAGNLVGVTRPGNNAATSLATAYEYDLDSGDGYHNVPSYNPATSSTVNTFTSNDYNHPLTVTQQLYSGNDSRNPVTHYRYDDQGHVYTMYDALGNETDFGGQQVNNTGGYNAAGQLLQVTYPATGQTGSGRSYTKFTYLYVGGPLTSKQLYDESGNLVRQTNYTYGPEGELLSVTGSTEPVAFAYDALYRLSGVQDGNGQVTHYYYNAAGYLDSITYPGYSGAAFPNISGLDSLHYTYDAGGNVATRTDGNGVVTSYNHTSDPESLLTSIQYSSGAANVALGYDGYGRLSSMTDGTGAMGYTYDDLDNPLTVQTTYTGLPAQSITYGYYKDGSRGSMYVPGRSYLYTYDAIGRLTGLMNQSQSGESAAWQYYLTGWPQTQTDSNGLTAQMTYNSLGQLIDLKNAVNGATLSEYGSSTPKSGIQHDAAGNLTSVPAVVGSSSGTATYAYGTRDQLTQESSVLGGFTNIFAYDTAGNPTSLRGLPQFFNFDNQALLPAGNNAAFASDGNGNSGAARGHALTFDAENRLTLANDQTTSVPTAATVGPDNVLRLLSTNSDGSVTVSNISLASGGGVTQVYGPYTAGGGWSCHGVAVGSDANPRVLWTNSNGTMSVWTLGSNGSFTSTPGYGPYTGNWACTAIAVGPDGLTRALWIAANGTMQVWRIAANGAVNATPGYTASGGWSCHGLAVGPDNKERVLWTNVNGSMSVWTITLNADGTNSFTSSPGYSATPGWTCTGLSVGPDNLARTLWVRKDGAAQTWQLNTNGSVTYSPVLLPQAGYAPVNIAMDYFGADRLLFSDSYGDTVIENILGDNATTGVQYTAQAGHNPATAEGNAYRGDGLRASKSNAYGKTYYLYDGTNPVVELNSSGQAVAQNMFGANGIVTRNPGNGTSFYALDERGNVSQRLSSSGAVQSTDLYDAYGKLISGNPSGDPYGFGAKAGYYTDSETGLISLTHRFYDPQQGRLLSRDPSGYGSGINLYSYVQNNPANSWDPLGLCGGDDAEPGFWDAVGSGLNVGVKATASALSFGLYDGGDAKCDPDFGTSKKLAGIGRDAAIMAATAGTGEGAVAAEEGAEATEGAAEGVEAAESGRPCLLCFTASTPVEMADGSVKAIASVQPGDWVKSRNETTGKDEARQVTASIKRLAPAVVTVTLADSKTGRTETLTCTPEHPFFTVSGGNGKGGWVEAGSLGIGTSIVSRAGPTLSVTGLVWKRDSAKELAASGGVGSVSVYNLTVEGDHTFFVGNTGGGTWVHNINCAEDLDLERDWRFHYSNKANLDETGLEPGEGTQGVFMTDMLPDVADPEATSALTGAGPLKYGYPVDVTGLDIEEAGSGFSNGASDEFFRGSIPPSRVLPPYTLY